MKFTKETQLNSHIKEHGLSGLYFLYGSEQYLITRWKEKLTESFEKGGFNLSILAGQQLDMNQLYDDTQQLPIFSTSKCVLVSNIDIKKLVTAELKKLEEVFSDLPPETLLVITAPLLDSKLATAKKLIALADKYGVAAELAPRTATELVGFLQSLAKESGCTIDPATAKEMIRICGSEMQKLTTEMGKVTAYAGGGEINRKHLNAVVTVTTEEKVFDLSKMILAGNTNRALEIVGNLLYLRESPIMIISTLIMSYVDIYRGAAAKAEGKTVNHVTSLFPYKGREFRARNAFGVRISKRAALKSLQLLYTCDLQMKSTMIEDSLLLEKTVIQLIYMKDR